ncbi:eukaryotic translation initiation factor 3 subunit A-like isoform X2 [Watersipora subatra]|uniref:eukaryotic translation initiation factor 3 subunit A-like isoform X2 n=1 Tax=Watersipora subatra TaxID=2589382 RepID=UPI00355B1656
MPTYFQKPENALKRAGEFMGVSKPEQALDVLYDVIKSKRHRTWQKTHEPIMMRYLELCVDLKKSHLAKEGLYQYKNICQMVNVKSLDTVIRHYLDLASQKTEAAREESQQTCLDIDDLDIIQTPERMANRVLCSTLSIPIPPTRYSIDQLLESNDAEKRRRLASLLSLSAVPNPPTRASLIKELMRNNVLQYTSPEIKSMYLSLEVEFDPLNLSSKLSKCMDYVGQQEYLTRYVDALQEMTVIRLIKQVAQIYQCVEFERLRALIPFVSPFELERIVVQAAKNIDLPVRLDHLNQSVSFGTDLNVCLQEDVEEGPFLQHMPGEQLRNQLQHMAKALCSAITKLNADDTDKALNLEIKLKKIDAYKKSEKRDRERILTRKNEIESRKEKLEIISKERDEQELEREREKQKQLRDAEELRLKREMAERERQRAQQEHENIRKKEVGKRIEQLKTTDIGIRALEGLTESELAKLDTDDILQKQVEQLEKEKKELQERLKSQDKKVDYFIRAKRLVEIPLLEQHVKDKAQANREQWDIMEAQRIRKLEKDRELAMKNRDRLIRMVPDKEAFIEQLTESRKDEYNAKLDVFNQLLAEKRSERLAERREARKHERMEKALRAREERRQRERDEAARKEREERIAREIEEEERKRRAEEERLAKLDELAAKKRQRELEVEQKLARDRENIAPSAGAGRSGGWREREAAKHDSWMKRRDTESRDDRPWGRENRDEARRDQYDAPCRDFRGQDSGRRDLRDDDRSGGGWRGGSERRGDHDRFERRGDSDRWSRGGEERWSRGGDARYDNHPRQGEDSGRERDFGRRDDHRDDRRSDSDRGSDPWRRGGDSGPVRRGDGPPRGSSGASRDDEVWRRGGDRSKRNDEKPTDSDGWSTVRYK